MRFLSPVAAIAALLLLPTVAGQAQPSSQIAWDLPESAGALDTAVVPVNLTLSVSGIACASAGPVYVDVVLRSNATPGIVATWHPTTLVFDVPGQALLGGTQRTLSATLALTFAGTADGVVGASAEVAGTSATCPRGVPSAVVEGNVNVTFAPEEAPLRNNEAVPGPPALLVAMALAAALLVAHHRRKA